MESIRIAHTADLHLGSKLPGLGKKGSKRSAEVTHTFFRILDDCVQKGIQLLLIAGDFLESSDISKPLVESIKEHMALQPSLHIFISPGNHDYMSTDSPYAEAWPENVHIFRHGVESVSLPQWRVVVYGAAFQGTYQTESLLRDVDWEKERKDTKEMTRLLVIHGDWNKKSSPYHPILPEDLPVDFFTYVALGHVHRRSPLYPVGQTLVSYSGCPDGRGFDETEEKGIYWGAVAPFSTNLTFAPFSSRLFRRLMVDGTEIRTQGDAENQIKKSLLESVDATHYPLSEMYARVFLKGKISDSDAVDIRLLQETLQSEIYDISIFDERESAINWSLLCKEESLRGYFAKALFSRLEAAQKHGNPQEVSQIKRAFRLGMEALDGKELSLANYTD